MFALCAPQTGRVDSITAVCLRTASDVTNGNKNRKSVSLNNMLDHVPSAFKPSIKSSVTRMLNRPLTVDSSVTMSLLIWQTVIYWLSSACGWYWCQSLWTGFHLFICSAFFSEDGTVLLVAHTGSHLYVRGWSVSKQHFLPLVVTLLFYVQCLTVWLQDSY